MKRSIKLRIWLVFLLCLTPFADAQLTETRINSTRVLTPGYPLFNVKYYGATPGQVLTVNSSGYIVGAAPSGGGGGGTALSALSQANGYIGINVPNPAFQLDVNGSAHYGDNATANPNPSQNPYITVNRTLSSTQASPYYAHAITDDSVWNCPTCNPASAYASFDSRYAFTGAVGHEHYVGFQSIPYVESSFTGTINRLIGTVFSGFINCGSCTVNSVATVEIDDYSTTSNFHVPNNYGVHCTTLSQASANFCFYSDTNGGYLGGSLEAGGSTSNPTDPIIVDSVGRTGTADVRFNDSSGTERAAVGFANPGFSSFLGGTTFIYSSARPICFYTNGSACNVTIDIGGAVTALGNFSAASYSVGATAGFTGTKTAGACTFTISSGIITNVTGC